MQFFIPNFIKKKRDTLLFIFLIFLSLMFLIFFSKESKERVDKIGYAFVSTIQKGFVHTKSFFTETVTSISELRKLKNEYNSLKKNYEENKKLERSIDELKSEIARLNEQLNFSYRINFEHISAKIIFKDPGYVFHNFTINVGSTKGIEKNMAVIAYQDERFGLVGKIIEVTPLTSHVTPLYSPECFVAARLENSRFEGIVNGVGYTKDFLLLDYVSKLATNSVNIGDLVVTSGMQSIYPYGIPIGYINKISSINYESSLKLNLTPVINFSKLEYVYVLKSKENFNNE